jgi:hypothetical protein
MPMWESEMVRNLILAAAVLSSLGACGTPAPDKATSSQAPSPGNLQIKMGVSTGQMVLDRW